VCALSNKRAVPTRPAMINAAATHSGDINGFSENKTSTVPTKPHTAMACELIFQRKSTNRFMVMAIHAPKAKPGTTDDTGNLFKKK